MVTSIIMHRVARWVFEHRGILLVMWWALVVALTVTTCEVAAVARDVALYRVWAERGPSPRVSPPAATVANVGPRAGDNAGVLR